MTPTSQVHSPVETAGNMGDIIYKCRHCGMHTKGKDDRSPCRATSVPWHQNGEKYGPLPTLKQPIIWPSR
jgi:hypothetical protein